MGLIVHINETLFGTLMHVLCINIYMLLYTGFSKTLTSSTDS